MQKGIVTVFAFTVALVACASQARAGYGVNGARIVRLYPHANGYSIILDQSHSKSTCDGGKRFNIVKGHKNYDAMVSTVIAAFMAQKKLNLVIEDEHSFCAPPINRLQVLR